MRGAQATVVVPSPKRRLRPLRELTFPLKPPKLADQVCMLGVERMWGVGRMRKRMTQTWEHHVQRCLGDRSQLSWGTKNFDFGGPSIKVRDKRE